MLVDEHGELIDLDPNGSIYLTRKKVGDALILEFKGAIVVLVIDKITSNHAALTLVAPNEVLITRGKRV